MQRDDAPAGTAGTAEQVLLGRIVDAQGLKGEVRINSFTGAPEDIAAYGPVSDGAGRSFVIERVRPLKGGAVVAQLRGVTERTAAEALKGTELFVARAVLPEPDEDEWYYEDLVGLKALAPDGAEIGAVVAVQNFGGGDLLEIKPADSAKTVFVPFTKAAVPVVDVKGGRVVVEQVEDEDEQP
jgi:16S rRNA processing protein RimM